MKTQEKYAKTQLISDMLEMGWWEMNLKDKSFNCSAYVSQLLGIPPELSDSKIFTSLIREDYRARIIHMIQSAPITVNTQQTFPVYVGNGIIWVTTRFRKTANETTVAGMMYTTERAENDLPKEERANETLQNFIYQLHGVSRSLYAFLQNENLDDTVNQILASLVTYFSAERSYIFSYDWEAEDQSCIYESLSREELAEIQNLQHLPLTVNPWWTEQMSGRHPIILSTLDDLPAGCHGEKEALAAQNIQSLMVVPFVSKDNTVWGYAGIDLVDHQRNWTQEDFEWFSSLMHIINICIELGKSKVQIQHDIEVLEERETLLTTIYDNLPVGMELYDKNGDLLYANDKDIEILGLDSQDDWIGCNVFDHPCLPDEVKQKIRKGKKADFNISYDYSKVGEYFKKEFPPQDPKNLIIKVAPIFDKQQKIQNYLFIVIDNTELQDMILAKNKAEALDRLKSAFLANMSHEIRTPLNSIIGFSDLLAETDDEEERKEFIGIIQRNNELLLKLVTDILDLSKIESGTFDFVKKEIEVKPFCSEVIQSFQTKQLPEGVQLVFNQALPEEVVYADPARVKQVLFNFITNALKFTEEGYIRLGYQSQADDMILFYVEDTGKGIAPEDIVHLFDRFFKINSFTQGTGLGLPICKSLIEEMGGCIGVDSTPGQGSRFWFTLPKQAPQVVS